MPIKKETLVSEIETLLADGKPGEAISCLMIYVKDIDRYCEKDLLLQKANLTKTEHDYQNNLINRSDYKLEIAKINHALTQIIDKLPSEGNAILSKEITETESENPVRKILFLTANPIDSSPLRLEEELRKVKDELSKTTIRDRFQLISESAVKIPTITHAMQRYNPEIVHFSGHGTGKKGIVVEDEQGDALLFPNSGISRLFKLFRGKVKCVLLNACYSKEQAKIISKEDIYVVGMNNAINDRAAIDFAVGFYQSLGENNEFEFAYQIAMINIAADADDATTPEIWFRGEKLSS